MYIIKKYRFEILIFIVEAVCMMLELVASRILSPFFGNSNIVWTSVIGIILFSSSVGNFLGGKIADQRDCKRSLKYTLLISAIFILIIPLIQNNINIMIIKLIPNIKIGAIISTIFLFLIPSIFLGIIPPIILKLKLENMENAGRISRKNKCNCYNWWNIWYIFSRFLVSS